MIRKLSVLALLTAIVSASFIGCASSTAPNALRGQSVQKLNDKGRTL